MAARIGAGNLMALTMRVNGRPVDLAIEPRETLLDVLRERLGLTGTKRSCDVQVCGACTVLVDGAAMSACTFLAYEARDRDVLTVEGLATDGELHPIQQAFVDNGGLQCGFCTPGMVMATKALLEENPSPRAEDVRHYLRGNICRCTGYKKIEEAVLDAAARLRAPAP